MQKKHWLATIRSVLLQNSQLDTANLRALRWTPETGPGNKVVFPRFTLGGEAWQVSGSHTA